MRKKNGKKTAPIIRFRMMLKGTIFIAVLIAGPLCMVWKQVYITSASMKIERMTDSLGILNGNIAELTLRCENLSSNSRIERIASKSIELSYPSTEQIVIIKIPDDGKLAGIKHSRDFLAFIKRSFFGDNG